MPYLIAPKIKKNMAGLWGEGAPYESRNIYDINSKDPKAPPVQYDEHIFRPHSLCHFDAPAHIVSTGESIDGMMETNPKTFYGPCRVVTLSKPNWIKNEKIPNISHWRVTLSEFLEATKNNPVSTNKIILSFEGADSHFFQSTQQAFTVDAELAKYLVDQLGVNLFGTVWKSADFEPGSRERPIHKIFFASNCGILECLDMANVPEGEYFISAYPLPIEGSSESPVSPVLFSRSEIAF